VQQQQQQPAEGGKQERAEREDNTLVGSTMAKYLRYLFDWSNAISIFREHAEGASTVACSDTAGGGVYITVMFLLA
jgi:hypothetical protein